MPEAIERRISIEPAAKLEKERAESALEVLDDLLTLATRESGLKSLPINAQRRIDSTPTCNSYKMYAFSPWGTNTGPALTGMMDQGRS